MFKLVYKENFKLKNEYKYILSHDVGFTKEWKVEYYVDFLHIIGNETNDLNKRIYDNIYHYFQKQHVNTLIRFIRLPMILMFRNKWKTNNALFTENIELQHKTFIGPLDDELNGKCVYVMRGFLVRNDDKCISYIRKNDSKSGETQYPDRWYKCDVTGKINESTNEYQLADDLKSYCEVKVEQRLRTVVETVVSNVEGRIVLCFYEAEQRIDDTVSNDTTHKDDVIKHSNTPTEKDVEEDDNSTHKHNWIEIENKNETNMILNVFKKMMGEW